MVFGIDPVPIGQVPSGVAQELRFAGRTLSAKHLGKTRSILLASYRIHSTGTSNNWLDVKEDWLTRFYFFLCYSGLFFACTDSFKIMVGLGLDLV